MSDRGREGWGEEGEKSKRNGGRKERRRDQERRPRNKKAACLPACLPAACLLASHPKFPSRYVYAYICVRDQSMQRCQLYFVDSTAPNVTSILSDKLEIPLCRRYVYHLLLQIK